MTKSAPGAFLQRMCEGETNKQRSRATHGVALLQEALQLTGIPSSEVNVLADMRKALADRPVAGLPQQQR